MGGRTSCIIRRPCASGSPPAHTLGGGDERPRHHGGRGARCYFPTRLKSMKPRSTSTDSNCTRTRSPTSSALGPRDQPAFHRQVEQPHPGALVGRAGHQRVELLADPRLAAAAPPPICPTCRSTLLAASSCLVQWVASVVQLLYARRARVRPASAALSSRWVIRSV